MRRVEISHLILRPHGGRVLARFIRGESDESDESNESGGAPVDDVGRICNATSAPCRDTAASRSRSSNSWLTLSLDACEIDQASAVSLFVCLLFSTFQTIYF